MLTRLSDIRSYRRVSDSVTFLVGISVAQPPITHNDLIWEGNNINQGQLTISLEENVAVIMINNLNVQNTGEGRLLVVHPAENGSESFNLTVWSKY